MYFYDFSICTDQLSVFINPRITRTLYGQMSSAHLVFRAEITTPAIYAVYLVFPHRNQQFSWWLTEHAPGSHTHTHTQIYAHIYRSCFSSNKMEHVHIAECVCVRASPCLLTVTYFYVACSLRMIKILQFSHLFIFTCISFSTYLLLPSPHHYPHLVLFTSPLFPLKYLFMHIPIPLYLHASFLLFYISP